MASRLGQLNHRSQHSTARTPLHPWRDRLISLPALCALTDHGRFAVISHHDSAHAIAKKTHGTTTNTKQSMLLSWRDIAGIKSCRAVFPSRDMVSQVAASITIAIAVICPLIQSRFKLQNLRDQFLMRIS
jgi:hypothetical protein